MHYIGAAKISLSALSSESLWQESGRLASTSELFKLRDRKDTPFLLAPTHEEEITAIVRSHVHSYKDLPLYLYQVSRKYRDELRPRGGLLRSREFVMKDLYTFDRTVADALETYERVLNTYRHFFTHLRLPYFVAEASSGDMGGEKSHEFLVPSASGEDSMLTCGECRWAANEEMFKSVRDPEKPDPPDKCPQCGEGNLQSQNAIEVGHTFFLGTRYSQPLGATVSAPSPSESSSSASDSDSSASTTTTTSVPIQMGCHGIGVSRLIAVVTECMASAQGLKWPRRMAPFQVAIILSAQAMREGGGGPEKAYDLICHRQMDPVLDDRDKDLAWKLKDADLIGYPVVVVMGRDWVNGGNKCEVQCRQLRIKGEIVELEKLAVFVKGLFGRLTSDAVFPTSGVVTAERKGTKGGMGR